MSFFRKLLNTAAVLLFPPRCVCCGEILPANTGRVCGECANSLNAARLHGTLRHSFCQGDKQLSNLQYAVCSYVYEKAAIQLVLTLKRGDSRDATDFAADAMAQDAAAYPQLTACDAIVPVPSAQIERIHAALLAQAVGKHLGIPTDCSMLIKLKKTKQQHWLEHSKRSANVRGAFAAQQRAAGKNILLCDDVVTTAATLNECARVLLAAGAASVCAVALASAPISHTKVRHAQPTRAANMSINKGMSKKKRG